MLVVIMMRVEDEVRTRGEVTFPVLRVLETTLEHDGDVGVHRFDPLNHSPDVLEDPGGAVVRQGEGRAEDDHVGVVVGGFVDGLEGVGLRGSRGLDEVDDLIDHLHGVVEVGLVVEPVPVAGGFADGQAVDAAGEGVRVDDDVHVVSLDGVVGDFFEVGRLVSRVELRAGEIDPCGIGGGDAQDCDTAGGELVNVGLGDPGCVAVLEDGAAL